MPLSKGPGEDGVSRFPRSAAYIHWLRSLDQCAAAGSTGLGPLVVAVAAEFMRAGCRPPQSIAARCFLGVPFEVHVLDVFHGILDHYQTFCLMPVPFEPARSLALDESVAAVEIYSDCCICVGDEGRVLDAVEPMPGGG